MRMPAVARLDSLRREAEAADSHRMVGEAESRRMAEVVAGSRRMAEAVGSAFSSPFCQETVTMVPATLSWTACFCGSHNIHSHPIAPTMQIVNAYSTIQMTARRAALPMVGY